jgi:uncharacterized SAM-binding protein YcdF (DUF218 family)
MFFVASKIFWLFVSPLHLSLFCAAFGVWRLSRPHSGGKNGVGAAWLGLGLGFLALMTFTPLGAALLRPLEDRFPPPGAVMPAPDGIIVLGGAVDERIGAARGGIGLNEAAERMTAGAALARAYPQASLVFSGGSGALVEQDVKEADAARKLWRELGVPDSQMTFENRSRNTYENALFTQALVHPRGRWLLVTSAWHMPRAMGIFRALGMAPTAYPVD